MDRWKDAAHIGHPVVTHAEAEMAAVASKAANPENGVWLLKTKGPESLEATETPPPGT